MLSRKSLIAFKRVILFGKRTLAMPYDWDHTMNRVCMGSLKQKFVISLISVYLYMEAIYQAWVLYAESGDDGMMPFQSYMKLITHFATRLTGTIITSMAFTNAWRKEYFINQIFYLNQRLQGYDNQQQKKDPCERLFRFLVLFCIFQPLITAINYIGENKDQRYWHGALLPSSIQPFFIPLFFVVEYWISLVAVNGTLLTAYVMVSYFRCAPQWTRLLIEKETEIMENEDEHDTYIYYRAQQILNQVYNNAYSFFWAFGMVATLLDLVMMIVCTIRLTPTTPFPDNLIFPVGLLGMLLIPLKVFDPAADLTCASEDFIAHSRRSGGLEKMRRLRSLRPLTLHAWIFFTMNKSTTAAFINQTVDYSVSVLLMT